MKIELREITDENRAMCIALKTHMEQRDYICTNETSLKHANENPDIARAFAIYCGDEMIGFTMFAFDEANEDLDDRYWLWRFMIDASKQGKGYGSAALKEIIEYFKNEGADVITLSTKESNHSALGLYHKFGFKENGEMNEEEIVLKLRLKE